MHQLIAQLSDFFLTDNAVFYDIGTTSGSLVETILARHADKPLHITGLDVVPAMVDFARQRIADERASFVCADALDYEFDRAHLFSLCYTLQFIHPSVRIDLLRNIYDRLHWGGGLLLF